MMLNTCYDKGEAMLRLYEIVLDHTGHGNYPTRTVVAPDIDTAIAAVRKDLQHSALDQEGNPVPAIKANMLITKVDLIALNKIKEK